MEPKSAILITHSHWDREWYLSEEETRFRLAELIDRLLDILRDEPGYHSFWLDGQTIPIEDYAVVRPERMAELKEWLRLGKIQIGPWYVLGDEHLVSGEACIRNLLAGLADARSHGQRPAIGYMPDTFGHMDQLPQLLRGFGIDNAVFWRGYNKADIDAAETTWTGRDGTRIKALCLISGYSNTRGITADLDATADRIDGQMETLRKYCASGTLLLMNGIDHALPLAGLSDVLPKLEKRFPGLSVRHADLKTFLGRVADKHDGHRPLQGELFHVPALDGCLSNRPAQKRLNRLLENRLAHYAEPLALMANRSAGGIPPALLARAWRLLLQCHPHDTICGCHADTVAHDMENRLERGLQVTTEAENRAVHLLLGSRDGYRPAALPCWIAVFNPLPWRRDEVVEIELPLPAGSAGDLHIENDRGETVPAQIAGTRSGFHTVFHDFKIPDRNPAVFVKLRFDARQLAPMGLTCFKVTARAARSVSTMDVTGKDRPALADGRAAESIPNVLENSRLRVTVHADGTLDILNKQTGFPLQGLNSLRLQPDRGDLYHFAPELADNLSLVSPGSLVRPGDSPFHRAIRVRAALAFKGETLPITIDVALPGEKTRVEIRVSFNNTARDFRLQTCFPIPSAGTALAHTPFSLSPRQPVPPQETILMEKDKRLRVNAVSQPLQYMIQFNLPEGRALAVHTRGVCEYTWEQPQRPCLTLMRATGRINEEMAGFSSEGGQSPGPQFFEYALTLAEKETETPAIREAFEFNLPPFAVPLFTAPTGPAGTGFEFTNARWMPAAFKSAESGGGQVVRFWNASEKDETGEIRLPAAYTQARRARPDETPLGPLDVRQGAVRLTAKPFEIVTILLD